MGESLKKWCTHTIRDTESKIFKEQKTLIEMVKQKHASLDKLLTAMLQQTSRVEDSNNETLE